MGGECAYIIFDIQSAQYFIYVFLNRTSPNAGSAFTAHAGQFVAFGTDHNVSFGGGIRRGFAICTNSATVFCFDDAK